MRSTIALLGEGPVQERQCMQMMGYEGEENLVDEERFDDTPVKLYSADSLWEH